MYTWAHHLYPMLLESGRATRRKASGEHEDVPFGFADDPAAQPADSTSPHDRRGATEETTLLGRAAQAGVVAADYAEYGAASNAGFSTSGRRRWG